MCMVCLIDVLYMYINTVGKCMAIMQSGDVL